MRLTATATARSAIATRSTRGSDRARCSPTSWASARSRPSTVDWPLQLEQRAKRIDARLPASLIALPTQISGSAPGTDYASLANRDLQRGQAVGLPSGEAVAERLGVTALSAGQVGLAEHGWSGETPLWLYVLKAAEVLHAGDRLGPVGGRIVGEVLVGIVDDDPESFRSVDPGWSPTLPARASAFGLADVLAPVG